VKPEENGLISTKKQRCRAIESVDKLTVPLGEYFNHFFSAEGWA
jgi:hypothetical protein